MPTAAPRSSSRSFRFFAATSLVSSLALISVYVVFAAISLSTSTPSTQNFDGIGTTATATLPTDFKADRLGTVRTVGTYAGAGSATTQTGGPSLSTSAANGIYNFGSGTTNTGSDRAVGFLSSGTTPLGTQSGNLYAQFANNTGNTLSGLTISYDVEKYRNGSNPAGFRVQLFYSTDGTNWTNAGANFLTTFAANADNLGCSTAPCSTTSVTNQALNVSIPSASSFYLAWNYSVASGTTTTNAQALGVDNISVLGISGGGATNPTGVGAASPSSADQGGTTLLTVAVTAGANPPTTAHTVSANLSSIGGNVSQSFFDDGTNGDVTIGDNIFSYSATVSGAATPGAKSLPVTITATAPLPERTGNTTIALTVNTPTSPTGVGAANPSSVAAGGTSLLTVTVTPGTHPTSTGISVTGDLSSIGGSAAQVFSDSGTNGDVTPGDNIFSFTATVSESTTAGLKTLPTTIADAQSRGGSANISLTVTSPTSDPSGTGGATPSSVAAGGMTLLTVTVTPGTGPASTGLAVTGDLSQIGGVANQQFFDDASNGDVTAGDNVFSFDATVATTTTAGDKNLPFNITDIEGRNGGGSISVAVKVPAGAVVISQVYGGGGNSGATYTNDFIEIFNRSGAAVNLTGWSVQYGSSGGTTWANTPLSGIIQPGQYFLVREVAGTGCGGLPCGVALPPHDVSGTINLSGTNGKVAVVNSTTNLSGANPSGGPTVIDLAGYGTANGFEGSAAAPGLSNTTADVRKRGGCKDTDDNSQDFIETSPNPRNSSTALNACPTSGDLSPIVESTSPASGAPGIDSDSNITVTFDEPVTLSANWIQISCANSGLHTFTMTGGPTTFTADPDVDFNGAEQCIVTVVKTEVFDQDLVDPPDNMDADYVFSFMTAIARDPAEHMVMGNPSGAVVDENVPLNYLMMKNQFALSYNNDKGTANWTSWHLDSTWTTGVADRQNDFRSDDTLPLSFKHVSSGYNFATYGFDRGHMCPSADRTSSIADNSATFLMTNMIPQASGNNQGPWASMENYIRSQLNGSTNELYIVSGGTGVGGDSSEGHFDTITDTAGNTVTVPNLTWKVVMVLSNSVGDDVARVDGSTRTFAVIMPNDDNIRPDQWQKYLATVDQVEAISGYDFYSQVPAAVQDVFEAKLDTVNDTAPVTSGQSKTTDEDQNAAIMLSVTDFNVNNTFTFTIVDQPTQGSVSCIAANCTYSPNANYFGPDSFTFKANDGALDSNVSTINITVNTVNDVPVATEESYSTDSNTTLNVSAPGVLSNDTDTEGSSLSAVLVTDVSHGSLTLQSDGAFSYTPALNFEGTDSFTYHAYDGADNSNTVTVSITVNDKVPPVLTSSVAMSLISATNSNLFNVGLTASATDNSGDTVAITVAVFGDEDDETATLLGVTHSPDAKDFAPFVSGALRLRGERVEANDGRVYLIIVTATDSSGNISRNYHTVVVPKNNKQANINSVNAQAAEAMTFAQANNGAPPPGYFVIGDGPIIGPKQ